MKINNPDEYQEALANVDYFMHHGDIKLEEDYQVIDATVDAIVAYETKVYPISPPSRAAVLEYEFSKRGCVLCECIDPDVFILSGRDDEPLKHIMIDKKDFDKTDKEKWGIAAESSLVYLESR